MSTLTTSLNSPHTQPSRSGRGWTLVITALSAFMLMLDITVVNVALPDIRSSFDASFTQLQWVLDSYAIGLAAILVASGSLGDRFGRRLLFTIGLIIFTVASLMCGVAWNIEVLIASRVIQGLGGAILFAVGPALIGNVYTGADRSRAFGIFGAVSGLAIAFGPLIGGGLTDGLDWRWIFLANVPVGLICLAITMFRVTESRSQTAPALDITGALTFSTALTCFVFALLRGEAEGWTSSLILGLFTATIIASIIFVLIQIRKGDQAMFDMTLFRNRTYNGLNIVTLAINISVFAAIFLFVTYLQSYLGYSAWDTGLRALPLTLTLFVGAAATSELASRTSPRVVLSLSLACVAVGLLLINLVDVNDSWTSALPMMFVLGMGMGLFNPVRAELSVSTTTPDRTGVASGVNETFQQVGTAVGIAGIGALFANRVNAEFTSNQATAALMGSRAEVADVAATGGGNVIANVIPEAIRGPVVDAANSAFIESLHLSFTVAAGIAAVGLLAALFSIRRSDLVTDEYDEPQATAPEAFIEQDRESTRSGSDRLTSSTTMSR